VKSFLKQWEKREGQHFSVADF